MVESRIKNSGNGVTHASGGIQANPVVDIQSKNMIDIGKIAENIIPKAIELTTRTVQRISDEKQIIRDVVRILKGFDSNLKVMPFGSATYGFGGPDTNFNICLVNNGNGMFHKSSQSNSNRTIHLTKKRLLFRLIS